MDRDLQFEHLEPRLLLSADWPASLGHAADLFVDGGANLSQISLRREATLLSWTRETLLTSSSAKTKATIGGNAADLNGALLYPDGQPRVPVLYVNGGAAGTHGGSLGASGRQAIRDFVAAGGSYTGSCAGAFLIADYSPRVLHLWNGYMPSTGQGSQTVSFAAQPTHPVAEYLAGHGVPNMTVERIPHYWGPRFGERYRHPEGTSWSGTITASSVGGKGTPYLLEYRPTPESGLIVVQPSHPEYGRRASHTVLMAGILDYARQQANVLPDTKAALDVGDSLVSIVGDQQYHLFTVNVPAGLSSLTISLSGMSANADLYLQRDGYAHELSYLAASTLVGTVADEVTVGLPEPGLWHVSVHGEHAVRNGTAYTLAVTAVLLAPPPLFVMVPDDPPEPRTELSAEASPSPQTIVAVPPAEPKLALLALDGGPRSAAVDEVFSQLGAV